jgi:hypothetical protein
MFMGIGNQGRSLRGAKTFTLEGLPQALWLLVLSRRERRIMPEFGAAQSPRGATMSKDTEAIRQLQIPWTADSILLPADVRPWTYSDHLRHLAGHRGLVFLPRDEYGRCAICVRKGFFEPDG